LNKSIVILVIGSLALGIMTTLLAHLLAFGVTEGGRELLWGHDFHQTHLEFFHTLRPVVVGVVIGVCMLVLLRGSNIPWLSKVTVGLLIIVLAWLLPYLSTKFGMSENLYCVYLFLLAIVASTMWAKILNVHRQNPPEWLQKSVESREIQL